MGSSFTQFFIAPGTYLYHCSIHRGMVGEIDVRRVTLQPLPPRAVAAGSRVTLLGRTVDPAVPVRIQRDPGTGFETVATASPGAGGTWKAHVVATRTVRYRAAVGVDLSEARRLLVISRRVQARVTRGVISVKVIPRAPHARVTLQLYLRARFGWWPARDKRLEATSKARFQVRGPVRARVALRGLGRLDCARAQPSRAGRPRLRGATVVDLVIPGYPAKASSTSAAVGSEG